MLAESDASLSLCAPGRDPIAVGSRPRARVTLRDARAWRALTRGDGLALARAYVEGDIDVEGDLREVMKLTRAVPTAGSWRDRLLPALRSLRPGWRRHGIAHHYDRPPSFFLPWLERSRSYSHGFYEDDDEPAECAQARKLQFALDALDVDEDSRVLDVGCGWGAFVEYAGMRGVRVDGLTLSRAQHAFVAQRIRELALPCRVALADFFAYRPEAPYDAAVLMGSLEHLGHGRRVARRLAEWLAPGARLYADFCAQRDDPRAGAFLARHVWPGPASYVRVEPLVHQLETAGFRIDEIADDTLSYARTVRDWGDALERERKPLAEAFGEPAVRTFLLLLRGSQEFFETGRTQAHHLVATRRDTTPPGDASSNRTARTPFRPGSSRRILDP